MGLDSYLCRHESKPKVSADVVQGTDEADARPVERKARQSEKRVASKLFHDSSFRLLDAHPGTAANH